METLLSHTHKDRILASTEVTFIFFEADEDNYLRLCEEVTSLGTLPPQVKVLPVQGDYETNLRRALADLKERGQKLAPAFAFLDPFGFSLSMETLNQLLQFPRCEVFVNLMYRYVDMAMHSEPQARNLDTLFGCADWRSLISMTDPVERTRATLDLFSRQLAAEYVTHLRMIAANGVLKYALVHATNNAKGRELMKDAIWAITPDGSFTAFERDNPNQLVLIQPEPDLRPLENLLWDRYAGTQVRMDELHDWLVGELYCKKHLHGVLRRYRRQGTVEFGGWTGRFAFSKNPWVRFPRRRP